MPNWAANSTHITGPVNAMTNFYARLGSSLQFSTFFPVSSADIDRHIEAWSTRWDLKPDETEEVVRTPEHYHIRYMTAWSPPSKFLGRLAVQFPGLHIVNAYCEIGVSYYGLSIDEVNKHIEEHYNITNEVEYVPQDENGPVLRIPDETDEEYQDRTESFDTKLVAHGRLAEIMKEYGLEDFGG